MKFSNWTAGVAILFLVGFLSSCGRAELVAFSPPRGGAIEPRDPSRPDPEPSEAPRVTFAELKARVLQPNCMGCHRSFGEESSFARKLVAGQPAQSLAYQRVESGEMPPEAPMAPELIELLERYIEGLGEPPARQ